MKLFRIAIVAIALAAFTVLAQTQTRLLAGAASPAETLTPAAVPASIGIIDSSAFSDEKTGITTVMAAMKQLDTKFQPLRAEIRTMRDRLNTLRTDIQAKRAIQEPRVTAQQVDEADRLEVQIKRKAEDAQASYQKESLAVLDPLQKQIATALNAYAQAKGLTLVLDANRVPILYAATNLDITRDFIDNYNRKHPVGAAPARPARP